LDKNYTPQPYQQLSKILREMGDDDNADNALYLALEQDRQQTSVLRRVLLFLLKYGIGYGIGSGYGLVIFWTVTLVVVGTLVIGLHESARVGPSASHGPMEPGPDGPDSIREPTASAERLPNGAVHGQHADANLLGSIPARVAYSLHNLLPLIQLDGAFDEVRLRSCARWYFYVHRIIGWLLGVFILAALAGLTQG
jgi:hypothetical protein